MSKLLFGMIEVITTNKRLLVLENQR